MSRRVVAILVGTVLALAASTLWVPAHFARGFVTTYRLDRVVTDHRTDAGTWRWVAAWDARLRPRTFVSGGQTIDLPATLEPHGPVLAAEHTLILVLGGSLLALAVRRERRRRAEAGA